MSVMRKMMKSFLSGRRVHKSANVSEFEEFRMKVAEAYAKIDVAFMYSFKPLCNEDASEAPSYYDIFVYWVAKKLQQLGNGKSILDVGNKKIGNMMNSLENSVTALVLQRPDDGNISSVNYFPHDIALPLPFPDFHFDAVTSPATLHLIGLGRYGDRRDPYALLTFKEELVRVLRPDGKAYLLLPLGRDCLVYGLHFIYSFSTMQKIFSGFSIDDYMVDEHARFGHPSETVIPEERFSRNTDTANSVEGEYKIIYLEMSRSSHSVGCNITNVIGTSRYGDVSG